MKILIFSWRDIKNPEAGGVDVFIYEIMKRLVKRGHEVKMLVSKFKSCKEKETIDGIKIIRAGGKLLFLLRAKKYYEKYLSGEKFDVVIDAVQVNPYFPHKFVDGKTIAIIFQLNREYWFYEAPFPINFLGYYWLEKKWFREYAKTNVPVITISNSSKKSLQSLGFKKIHLVYPGVSKISTNIKKRKNPTIIYLGRLKRAKRPDHALEAFKIVKKEIPNAELWIVGQGYLRKKLEKQAKKIKDVKFFGYVSEKKKFELLSKAWLSVNPSVMEGWGIVVIESNACGTPCVGYNIPGLSDSIVNGKTGILVENGNIKKLAEAIIKILKDEKLRKRLSKNALNWSKKFSWDKSAEKFLKIISS